MRLIIEIDKVHSCTITDTYFTQQSNSIGVLFSGVLTKRNADHFSPQTDHFYPQNDHF